MAVTRVSLDGREIVLVETAHISKASVDEVAAIIVAEKPDVVGIELDGARLNQLLHEQEWNQTRLDAVIQQKQVGLFLLGLFLQNFQRQLGESVGVKPGAEMLSAVRAAQANHVPVALLDRNVNVTLQRALASIGWVEKARLLLELVEGLFGQSVPLTAEKVEELKQKDTLNALLEEFGNRYPKLKRVLVEERDVVIAQKIRRIDARKIVCVIGAGHSPGIQSHLRAHADFGELEQLPPQKKSVLGIVAKWLIPAVFVAMLAWVFYAKGPDAVLSFFGYWILITGGLSALGVLVARGHVLSILTAFVAAPITTLHPALAAGWFAGYAEARMRAPQVADFSTLHKLSSVGDFVDNRVTRILLVIALANLGAMLGSFLAFPAIAALLN